MWGLVGVVAFSLTVIATRAAVQDLPPLLVGAGRAVVAAVVAAAALVLTRQPRPHGSQWARLAVVGAGVVLGFPLLTTYALRTAPASHGAVVIALLPAATAVAVVLRTRERPPAAFWVAAGLGATAAVAFASVRAGGLAGPDAADALLLGAVLAAAVGYAEGGLLARELGAWQTISWALLAVTPVTTALTAVALVGDPPDDPAGGGVGADAWASLAYLSLVSAYLGFVAWYRGLALGPMARVSQVQLVQPVLSLGWAALLLHEPLTWASTAGAVAVVGCAAVAVRARTQLRA